MKSPNLSGNWSEFSWSIIQFLKIEKKSAIFRGFFVTHKGRWWSQLEVTTATFEGVISRYPLTRSRCWITWCMNIGFIESWIPGPSKACQMIPFQGVNSPSLRVWLAPLGRCWYWSLSLHKVQMNYHPLRSITIPCPGTSSIVTGGLWPSIFAALCSCELYLHMCLC